MALPTNANVIVVQGYWIDELTGTGVKQANNLPATIIFDPVPLLGVTSTKTPNLRDIASNAYLKTRSRVAVVDPDTGYFAAQLVASNDPDLEAYGGRRVTLLGEDPFIIEVPYSALSTTVDATMAAKTGLAQGASVRAIWLTEAAIVGTPPPQPANSYLTATQTLATLASGIGVHDADTSAHPDIRALLATVPEQARDALGAALVAGSNVTITPNDTNDTITISVAIDEQAQDAVAALFAAGSHSGISFAYNDAGNAVSATVSAQSWSQITGKPTFATVATTGSYTDLSNKPTITSSTLTPTTIFTSGTHTPVSGEEARYAPASAGSPANISVTLPAAAAGQRFGLVNADTATSTYKVTFTCAGTDTFDGGGTGLVLNPGERAVLLGLSGGFSVESLLHTGLRTRLLQWTSSSAFQLVSAARDTNEAITTASVVWPDGSTGTFTADTASSSFPGAIDAYHVTYVPSSGTTRTITQAAVTRDGGGAVTAQPALTIA